MCKESYIRPLENYVAKYGKDLRWLAIHCAMKPDDFLAKFQNKRATLGELMRTLEQGQIKLWLTLSGEQPNYRSRVNPRMQFLLDNLQKFKISNDTIQKWTGSANQLAKWQSEDDIALSALLEVTKSHPKTILWHFIGLGEGDREDTMRNTFHKPSGEPSPVSRAAEIRHANMEKLLKKELETEEAELPDKLQRLKEKCNGPAKQEEKPVPEKTVSAKTEDSAPAAPAQKKNEPVPAAAGNAAVPPEDGNERFSVSYSHKLHMKIKAIALAEGKTNYAVINELIGESVALTGKIKKPVRDYKYDELVRNFMIVPKENIQVLRDIGEKKGWRIWQVCEACLTAAIREREERSRKEIAAAIAESQAKARQQKSENKPEPAPATPEAAVTPASEKQIKNTGPRLPFSSAHSSQMVTPRS